jgi:enamine deaminase RidA (YjgF/YER057c/UK114 family)
MGRGDVVRVNAFVIDREDLKPYMAARDRWFAGCEPPASTLMLVSGFTRPEFKVEIEIVAAREAKA